jgi:hypothetical protein
LQQFGGIFTNAERERNRRDYQNRIRYRRERNKKCSVFEIFEQVGCDLEAQPGFANAARTGQSYQPHIVSKHELLERVNFFFAPDQLCGLSRQVVGPAAEGFECGKVRGQFRNDDLENAFRMLQIFEAMLAQIAQGDAAGQMVERELARGCRKQNLAAMSGRAETRGAMNVHPDVAGRRCDRLARVQSHPHAQGFALRPLVRCQPALRFDGGGDAILSARESNKEGVTGGIDFITAVRLKRGAHDLALLLQRLGIFFAEAVQQPGGAFNVTKQKCDRTGRRFCRHRFFLAIARSCLLAF